MADVTRYQPLLPPEQPYTKAEKFFVQLQPSIFPPNQDSNWGTKRKNFTDRVQDLIDQQELIWAERFISRSTEFLDEWEYLLGLPEAPAGKTIDQRRVIALARVRTGAFTRALRVRIIEPYIMATFGVSVELTPFGVSLVGGIPLLADAVGDPKEFYRIYEDVRNFSYSVLIISSMTPDMPSLTRELKRQTPAGITFTIDNSQTEILDYAAEVRNSQPAGYWRLGAAAGADASGNGLTGTWSGSPATVASPGLLHAAVAGGNGAMTLDGTNDYMSAPSDYRFHANRISLEAWFKPAALPAPDTFHIIAAESANDFLGIDGTTGNFVASVGFPGSVRRVVQGGPAVVGSTYHLASRFTGAGLEIFTNGVPQFGAAGGIRDIQSSAFTIGRAVGGGQFANGVVDEVAVYDRELTNAEILLHYNTGRHVLV